MNLFYHEVILQNLNILKYRTHLEIILIIETKISLGLEFNETSNFMLKHIYICIYVYISFFK